MYTYIYTHIYEYVNRIFVKSKLKYAISFFFLENLDGSRFFIFILVYICSLKIFSKMIAKSVTLSISTLRVYSNILNGEN